MLKDLQYFSHQCSFSKMSTVKNILILSPNLQQGSNSPFLLLFFSAGLAWNTEITSLFPHSNCWHCVDNQKREKWLPAPLNGDKKCQVINRHHLLQGFPKLCSMDNISVLGTRGIQMLGKFVCSSLTWFKIPIRTFWEVPLSKDKSITVA